MQEARHPNLVFWDNPGGWGGEGGGREVQHAGDACIPVANSC